MNTFYSIAQQVEVPSDDSVRDVLDRFAFLAFAQKLLSK
jgi:hypothetical protein